MSESKEDFVLRHSRVIADELYEKRQWGPSARPLRNESKEDYVNRIAPMFLDLALSQWRMNKRLEETTFILR